MSDAGAVLGQFLYFEEEVLSGGANAPPLFGLLIFAGIYRM